MKELYKHIYCLLIKKISLKFRQWIKSNKKFSVTIHF